MTSLKYNFPSAEIYRNETNPTSQPVTEPVSTTTSTFSSTTSTKISVTDVSSSRKNFPPENALTSTNSPKTTSRFHYYCLNNTPKWFLVENIADEITTNQLTESAVSSTSTFSSTTTNDNSQKFDVSTDTEKFSSTDVATTKTSTKTTSGKKFKYVLKHHN